MMVARLVVQGLIVLGWMLLWASGARAADPCFVLQSVDLEYRPVIGHPDFPDGNGRVPRVVVDSAHHNFHTIGGRYAPFAEALRRDGYVVEDSGERYREINAAALEDVDILVIANALHPSNVDTAACMENWKLPTPSAFSDSEISALKNWVEKGGSLLLISDHMPFAGAAEKLADAFGFTMVNGYALPVTGSTDIVFRGAGTDGDLADEPGILNTDHPILRLSRQGGARVRSVVSFVGSAFWAQEGVAAQPVLELGEGVYSFLPASARAVSRESLATTPRIACKGLLQGATVRVGRGRLAIFGEAAMFTAQKTQGESGPSTIGMNNPGAEDNVNFLLNVFGWLSDIPAMHAIDP